MTVITTRITVSPDGAISAATPLPAGEYIASITVHDQPARQLPALPFDMTPCRSMTSAPGPKRLSLRREDMYGDDGR